MVGRFSKNSKRIRMNGFGHFLVNQKGRVRHVAVIVGLHLERSAVMVNLGNS